MTAAQAQPGEPHAPLRPTVFDEKSSDMARTYADALVNATQKDNSTEEVLEDLDAIRDFVITRYPAFLAMIRSPVRSAADKDRVIVQTFEGRALPTSVRFLRVLNRHGRLDLLGPVLRAARATWERRQNRRPVAVRSAVPLTGEQQEALRERLARSLNATPVLRLEVDPALIGGLVVQVGDDVYDASVRNHLAQLRNRLTEGKAHG